jgi:TolB-like protein
MSSILAELKRRNIFRVAVAYAVVGWVVVQAAEFLSPLLRLPEWTVSFALFVGIIGFPIALVSAWAFELTPEGIKRTEDVHVDDSITHETATTLNRIIMAVMALAIVGLLVDRLYEAPAPDQAPTQVAETAVEAAAESKTVVEKQDTPGKPKSIAVLPFVNMSNDPDQEYFSDGISEELLNGLAKIRDLRVAARTSSFAFKGKNQDISTIGEQLKVEAILEGSVRKSGQRIRITAQLINVADGYHMWSETYDRDLIDIFAIQDEISAAIVTALKVHLTDDESLVSRKPVDLKAYNFFLLGRHDLRNRTESSLLRSIKQYQKAIDIDPTYAEAWAGQAAATALLSESDYGTTPEMESVAAAQALLDRAFALDPDLAVAHAVQALLYMDRSEYRKALQSIDRAIAINSNEGILYAWKSNALIQLGRVKEAQATLLRAFDVDPLHPTIRHNMAFGATAYPEQRDYARSLVTPGTANAYETEFHIARREGRYADAFRQISIATDLPDGSRDTRSHFFRSVSAHVDFHRPDIALEHARGSTRTWIKITSSAGEVIDQYMASELLALSPSERGVLLEAMAFDGRCEEAVRHFAPIDFEGAPMQGQPAGFNYMGDALQYALCLQRSGEQERAEHLAERIKAYIEMAVSNGQPQNYHDQLARVYVVLNKHDATMAELELAFKAFDFGWLDAALPWTEPLRERADYQDLVQRMYTHLNGERAKLGWEPLEVPRA